MKEPKKIECEHCGYEWYTKSDLDKVTCPNCSMKTENVVKDNEK